ncbi:MAG: amidase [Pseudomonadota bacterium]|nr:amidase [Pseudomonadota bacterium]
MKMIKHLLLMTISGLLLLAGTSNAAEFTQRELAYMPATLQIELFKRGDITPLDILKAQKAEYDRTEEKVNAVTVAYWDKAMEMAEASGQRYKDGSYGPLEGITVGIKDEHYDEGWVITMGSLVHKNDPPMDHADPIVAKLKAAGAIPVFQTTVPEMYLNFVTDTVAWGMSRNPWNLKYAVGGSSGGSGAALSAGYCTLAAGSDMGGSLRIPAAFNGLYTIKPAFGAYHTDLPMSIFSGSGPMARTFEDMVMMYNVTAGPADYSLNVMPSQIYPVTYGAVSDLKIAYIGGMGITEPSEEVAKAMMDAVEVLRKQGATVDVVDFSFGTTPAEMSAEFYKLALAGSMGGMFAGYANAEEELTSYFRYFVEKAAQGGYGNVQLGEAEQYMIKLYKALSDQLKGYDVVLTPTMPTSHIPADWDPTIADAEVIDGKHKFHRLVGTLYTIPFNFLNTFPVASVPAGLSTQNMPIGMQIVGKPFDTKTVFRVAHAFSKGARWTALFCD